MFSLISRSYILDLTPGNSFVEQLLEAGFDVYLLDWGEPDERDAENRLEDYVDDYLPAGIDRVLELSGADEVNLLRLLLRRRPDPALRRPPPGCAAAEPHGAGHPGRLPAHGPARRHLLRRQDGRRLGPRRHGNVPPSVVVQGFRALTPTAEVTRYVTLWERLWNDEYVASYQAMTGWSDDHVPFPGAAARETARCSSGTTGW